MQVTKTAVFSAVTQEIQHLDVYRLSKTFVCKRWRKKHYFSAISVLNITSVQLREKKKKTREKKSWNMLNFITEDEKNEGTHFYPYQVIKIQSPISPTTANSPLCYTPIFWYPTFPRLLIQENIYHLEKTTIRWLLWESLAWVMRWVTGLFSFTGSAVWVNVLA